MIQMSLFPFCSALGAWSTLLSLAQYPRQVAPYNLGESPLKLFFHTPANGSRVDGHDIKLAYTLYSPQTGRKISKAEARSFSESVAACFGLEGSSKPPACSPLDMGSLTIKDSVTIKDSELGAWVTVRAGLVVMNRDATPTVAHLRSRDAAERAIRNLESEWEDAGDSITLFVELRDNSSLHHDGESSYMSSYSSSQESMMREEQPRFARGTEEGVLDTDGRLAVRQALGRVFSSYPVTTMLDAGCGDVTWMPYYVDGIFGVRYSGADIEAAVVEDNRRRFEPVVRAIDGDEAASALQRTPAFVQANLIRDVPSSEDGRPFDLILVRDLMSLLPSSDNFRLLERLDDSGAKLLMATTFLEADENAAMLEEENAVGVHAHPINLALPPYCLRSPEAVFMDSGMGRADHRLALWELDPERPLLLTGDCTASSWEGVTLKLSRS